MKSFKAIVIGVLMGVFGSSTVGAFWVVPGFAGHESITREALGNLTSGPPLDPTSMTFHLDAIDAIVDANLETDDEGEIRYSPSDHYDNEEFANGAKRMMNKRRIVMNALRRGDPQSAWMRVGSILHGIQDFYAHSSWEDLQRSGVAKHYDLNLSNDSARLQAFMDGLGDSLGDETCGDDGVTLTERDHITSGYYEKPFFSSMRPYRPAGPNTARKCIHLGATNPVYFCSVAIGCAPTPAVGFEKDAPGSELAKRARDKARDASVEFVGGIIAELKTIGTPEALRGVCYLLGRDPNLCAPSTERTNVYRYDEICVQSVPGVYKETRIGATGQNDTRTVNQKPHVCVHPLHPVGQPVYFCREGTRWIGKRDYAVRPATSSSTTRRGKLWHDFAIMPDGTITGRTARVLRIESSNVEATFISVDDFDYSVSINDSTGVNQARLKKTTEDQRIGKPGFTSYRTQDQWIASGPSSLPVTFNDRFYFTRQLVATYEPGEKLPDYCFGPYKSPQ